MLGGLGLILVFLNNHKGFNQGCSQTFRSAHTLKFSLNERIPRIENLKKVVIRVFTCFFTQNVKNSQELLMAQELFGFL
jgi:hypothetical protein